MTRRPVFNPDDRLLTFEELADILGCSAGHLRNLKYRGRAPVAVKLGRSVRFRLGDVRAWIEARLEKPAIREFVVLADEGEEPR